MLIYEEYLDYLMNKRYMSNYLMNKFNIHINLEDEKIYIPSYDKDGNLNLYISRGIDNKADYFIKGNKNEIIFNHYLVDFNKPIILTEGFFDGYRLQNFIPLLGKDLSEESLLFKYLILHKTPIILILDNEEKTINNKIKIAEQFKYYNSEHLIYIGELKDNYKDIGSIKDLNIDCFNFFEWSDELKFNMMAKI